MTEPRHRDEDEEPIEEVVLEAVGDYDDETTRREAVEQELEERGRSEEGEGLDVSEIVESPAAGVIADDMEDPPEPGEPG